MTKCIIGKCEKYTELERAQWWFVGWRRAPTTLRHFMVTPRRKKADERLFVVLHGQAKEGGGM